MKQGEKKWTHLIEHLGGEVGQLTLRLFPDGETYLRVLTPVEGRDVIVLASLFHPNYWILNLLFLGDALKSQQAKRVTLIAPYLSYMRQDKVFHHGEALTSRTFANLLSTSFDAMITVDPHLHRYRSLDEIYKVPTTVLHAAPLIAEWIQKNIQNPIIIGPDRESDQWVSEVAGELPKIVLSKIRHDDGHVDITWPADKSFKNMTPVLVDDIISSGNTMIQAVKYLKNLGTHPSVCIAIHPLFVGNSYQDILEAGVKKIITCNTIPHPSNKINLTPLFINTLKYPN